MLRVQDLGELAYGGIVTGLEYWDEKRVEKGELAATSIWKKFSTWAYLGVGVIALAMTSFGWLRQYDRWTENISHGFIYGVPGFIRTVITNATATTSGTRGNAAAEAQRMLDARRNAANQRLLSSGKTTERTYQPEFKSAFVV